MMTTCPASDHSRTVSLDWAGTRSVRKNSSAGPMPAATAQQSKRATNLPLFSFRGEIWIGRKVLACDCRRLPDLCLLRVRPAVLVAEALPLRSNVADVFMEVGGRRLFRRPSGTRRRVSMATVVVLDARSFFEHLSKHGNGSYDDVANDCFFHVYPPF